MPGEISRSNPGPRGNTPPVPSWIAHRCTPHLNDPAFCASCWGSMNPQDIAARRIRYKYEEESPLKDAFIFLELISQMGSFSGIDGICRNLATCVQAAEELKPCEHMIARHVLRLITENP